MYGVYLGRHIKTNRSLLQNFQRDEHHKILFNGGLVDELNRISFYSTFAGLLFTINFSTSVILNFGSL